MPICAEWLWSVRVNGRSIVRVNVPRALLLLLTLAATPFPLSAQSPAAAAAPAIRDGSHDFDFHIGTWSTRVRRRLAPLTGSNEWVEMNGTTTVRKVWGGRANLVELEADGPKGPFRGLSLRLYHPEAGQWSLHFANAADGEMAQPTVGQFHGELRDIRGEFYDQETLRGRAILVRFVISGITPSAVHFEQAFSDDGGKTWEVNWIADDTRIAEGTLVDTPGFRLTSTSFAAGATLSERTLLDGLDCHGANASPALQWTGAPAGTKSFAVILDDYEARYADGFIHWAVYNLPATTTSLAENAGAPEGDLAGGGRHAWNDFLRRRYDGPCPPEGPPHQYRFTVFALDLPAIDDAGTPMTWRKLRAVIKGHILGQASLTGLRGH
jgi:Raf kinase inhibitor-like YbhB/YbcL family protein